MRGGKLIILTLAAASLLLAANLSSNDFESAERLFEAGDFSPAETLYSKVQPSDPNYSQAMLRLGTIYYATERPAQAEKSFQECLRIRESAEAYCLLSGAQFNQKKFTEAYDSAKKAANLAPRYAKAYTMLGMIYAAIGDWPDSQAAYRESLQLNRSDADTWYMMARSYFLRNDFREAKKSFEESLHLNPQQIRVYENLALTLDLMNDPAGAEKVYREGLRVNGLRKRPDPRLSIDYGKFLAQQGRAEGSLTQFREAVRVAPQNAEARYELANQYSRMKRWAESAQEAETALQVGGSEYRVHYLLARAYTALGKTEVAAQHAREAARLSGQQP